jgi:hypothetical protein
MQFYALDIPQYIRIGMNYELADTNPIPREILEQTYTHAHPNLQKLAVEQWIKAQDISNVRRAFDECADIEKYAAQVSEYDAHLVAADLFRTPKYARVLTKKIKLNAIRCTKHNAQVLERELAQCIGEGVCIPETAILFPHLIADVDLYSLRAKNILAALIDRGEFERVLQPLPHSSPQTAQAELAAICERAATYALKTCNLPAMKFFLPKVPHLHESTPIGREFTREMLDFLREMKIRVLYSDYCTREQYELLREYDVQIYSVTSPYLWESALDLENNFRALFYERSTSITLTPELARTFFKDVHDAGFSVDLDDVMRKTNAELRHYVAYGHKYFPFKDVNAVIGDLIRQGHHAEAMYLGV